MSEWISCDLEYPTSPWHIVFVTNGTQTCLARYIKDPKYWYGDDLTEYDDVLGEEIPLDEDGRNPHWLFITVIGPFIGNNACFTFNPVEITHWTPLPKPQK